MSFVESIFSIGFIHKTTKEDQNINRDHRIISSRIHGKVLEDTRGLHTKGGDQTLPGGTNRPPMPPGTPLWEATTSF
jgi:hypothetical protein